MSAVTRYLGRTTPAGTRLVFAIAFDEYGVLDTITNTATGQRLVSTTYDGRRIARNAGAIRDGAAPLDYWQAPAPVTPVTIQSVLRWAEQRRSDADGMAERFAELLSAAGDPLATAAANDSNWQARAAAVDRLRAAVAAAKGEA